MITCRYVKIDVFIFFFFTLITARIKTFIRKEFLNGANSFLNPAKPECYWIIQRGFLKRPINLCHIQKQFYVLFIDRM